MLCNTYMYLILNTYTTPQIYHHTGEFICECNEDKNYRIFGQWMHKEHRIDLVIMEVPDNLLVSNVIDPS